MCNVDAFQKAETFFISYHVLQAPSYWEKQVVYSPVTALIQVRKGSTLTYPDGYP